MDLLLHLAYFLLSASVIWFFSGLLVDSVDRVAKRFHKNGFTVAFFVLGLMTSISEISVMVNSSLNQTPQVSAGNLSGASMVILFLIVPLLAIMNKGIGLSGSIRRPTLALSLVAIVLPALAMADGRVELYEGLLALASYLALLYFVRQVPPTVSDVTTMVSEELTQHKHATLRDSMIILGGALAIFLAGHSLVEESVYFAQILGIPPSIVGLLLLSVGTNVPELVIAVRSIRKQHADIAFGDYMGSAVANTLIFGCLALISGPFAVEASEFGLSSGIMLVGLPLLYWFASSGFTLSRKEGSILLVVYICFVLAQITNVVLH